MIPNTTPTPNELFNNEMKKMSDTELRVVLIVTRSTFGWEVDHTTGMRKTEDWITRSQIEQKAGRGPTSISGAVDGCVKNGWIETRNENGKILKTPAERRHNKIFYRLGKVFLGKESPCSESEHGKHLACPESEHGNCAKNHVQKVNITKETLSQKKTLLSPIQEIVFNYKLIKGFEKIPNWDEYYFARASKSAKAILELTGNLKQSFICMKETGKYCDKKKLVWTIETVVKKFPEWKVGNLKLKSEPELKAKEKSVPYDQRPGYKALTKETREKHRISF